LVKPRDFAFNAQTAVSNVFQQAQTIANAGQLAQQEFEAVLQCLDQENIAYTVADSPAGVQVPDAVFPNNWLAVMPGGQLVLFPMLAPNRRDEINPALVNTIENTFNITGKTDLSVKATQNIFLEGTGSIVFDHDNRIAYACESPRTNIGLLEQWCNQIGYTPVSFLATDVKGQPIYHTNVVMSVGAQTVIFCPDAVTDAIERAMFKQQVAQTGKNLVDISYAQMNAFCGNVLQVQDRQGRLKWLMSSTAYHAFEPAQRQQLELSGSMVHVAIPTIETLGGGSLRCMLAGIHAATR
jgi:hypothetical protein